MKAKFTKFVAAVTLTVTSGTALAAGACCVAGAACCVGLCCL